MLNSGVMDIAYDEGHAYRLNNASWAVLKEGRKVNLTRYKPFEERQAEREAVAPKDTVSTIFFAEESITSWPPR